MTGERQLATLIAQMKPWLDEEEFVFCTIAPQALDHQPDPPFTKLSHLRRVAIAQFQEAEGISLILPKAIAAAHGLPTSFPCRKITLTVHSSLDAIGFLAAVTAELARHNISVNPVSAYFHDHLFVPCDRADEAMSVLTQMQTQATMTPSAE